MQIQFIFLLSLHGELGPTRIWSNRPRWLYLGLGRRGGFGFYKGLSGLWNKLFRRRSTSLGRGRRRNILKSYLLLPVGLDAPTLTSSSAALSETMSASDDGRRVRRKFIGAGCNKIVNNLSWGASGLLAFGVQNGVAVFCPDRAQILTTLPGHKAVVNCTHWLPSNKFAFKGTIFSYEASL